MMSAFRMVLSRWAMTIRVTPSSAMLCTHGLGQVVESAGGLIEQQHPGFRLRARAINRSLPLAPGQSGSALTDQRLHSHRHRADVVRQACRFGCLPSVRPGRSSRGAGDVGEERAGITCGLEYRTQLAADGGSVDSVEVAAVVGHGAGFRSSKPSRSRSIDDLPAPDGPTTATNWPGWALNERSSRTSGSPSLWGET